MKFIIDRPIKSSYSKEILQEQTHEFFYMEDKERAKRNKLRWIELDDIVIKGWIDDDGVCHRIVKNVIEIIDVTTLEELYALTKDNAGKIVFGTNVDHEDIDGWIEIYDDYRE
jgi:hypothetical protein